MPDRRRLAGLFGGLGEGIAEIGKLKLGKRLTEEQALKTQSNERINQLLNDFDTSARAISAPEHVAKVGADTARAEMASLRRRLPKGAADLVGPDPDFESLDSTADERQGEMVKELGGITNPDDPTLTKPGLTMLARSRRVPTEATMPSPLAPTSQSMDLGEDPEFGKLVQMVQGQREGLLSKETKTEIKDPLRGTSTFASAREQGAPGFSPKTGLTPEEEASKQGGVTKATKQAETDVENLPANQQGKARGAGLVAGAQKRAELAAELSQMGITGQQQTGALQLADDFEKASTGYYAVRSSLKNISALARQGTAAADIGIVYNIMTAFDPGSHVLAGEQATAQNAAGVPERLRQKWNKMMTGESLTPAERQDYVNTAKTLFAQASADHKDRVKDFTSRAAQLRVPASLVVREPSDPTAGQETRSPLDILRDRSMAPAGVGAP